MTDCTAAVSTLEETHLKKADLLICEKDFCFSEGADPCVGWSSELAATL